MELKILILSHGEFCEEIINSAEMIVGKNPNLLGVPLLKEDDQDTYSAKIKSMIHSFNNGPFMVIVDIMGGTPFNCAMKLLKEYTFCLVTGLNLAMMLEAYFLGEQSVRESAELMLEVSRKSGYLFDNDSL